MNDSFFMLVDGELISGASSFDVINPATARGFAKCPKADEAILNKAVASARAAFPSWAGTRVEQRAAYLEQLAGAMEARASDMAAILTREQGKPLDQAMLEVMGSAYQIREFAKCRVEEKVLRDTPGNKVIEHRTPLGVVAAITPWNFPLILLMNKVGPALITGNTVVVKPAPTTPLTTLLFGEVCAQVLPKGVVNIICDENDLGSKLTSHPQIDKVAFTGSTATGKKVMASAAVGVKRVTLELGGNDAAIVLDDVNPKFAAEKIFAGAMTNAGQICVAVKRAYVHSSIYDEFCSEIAKPSDEAVVDDGSKQGTQIGPVQNKAQYDKVQELIADARNVGKVIAGGSVEGDGYFIRPTIVRDIPEEARLVKEEQFGPVLPVIRFDEIEDVIQRANDSEFGLGGSVWGADVARATEVAMRIDSGTVWVNQLLAVDPGIPFRGSKQSGIGAELGEAGLEEYTQAHIVNICELGSA